MEIESFYHKFQNFREAVIDSRKVQPGDIFFAFSGENFNAATQAVDAVEKGALAVIVEDQEFADPTQNIFFVPSTLDFLQQLAKYHRKQMSAPFIGITGSNGKTTTKELIHAVLSRKYNVQFTYGNLNNHIGVPITVLSVKPHHNLAVIEMGANHRQEIAALCEIAAPDFGYISNFGKAHLEGFGGLDGVIKGKSELYDYLRDNGKTVLVNTSDEIQKKQSEGISSVIRFGDVDADYCFRKNEHAHFVGIEFGDVSCMSQLTGSYNFSNLSAAAAFGLHFGVEPQQICKAIAEYVPSNMRSQIVHKNGMTMVLDTYNANPSSMTEALRNFADFEGSKTVILGDMLELGDQSAAEHTSILQLTEKLGFDHVITVGSHFYDVNSAGSRFRNTGDVHDYLLENPVKTDNLLLKGSRGIALEKLLDILAV